MREIRFIIGFLLICMATSWMSPVSLHVCGMDRTVHTTCAGEILDAFGGRGVVGAIDHAEGRCCSNA